MRIRLRSFLQRLPLLKEAVDDSHTLPRLAPYLLEHFGTTSLEGMDLRGFDFSGWWLEDICFKDADLIATRFDNTHIVRCQFDGAPLRFSSFKGALIRSSSFEFCDLDGVLFEQTRFEDVAFHFIHFSSTLSMAGATLTEVDFSNQQLECADFSRASLYHAHLHHSCLEKADLSGTDLRCSDLEQANLSGANLQAADLTNANLHGTILTGIRNVTALQLSKAKNLEYAIIAPTDKTNRKLLAEALAAQFELIEPLVH